MKDPDLKEHLEMLSKGEINPAYLSNRFYKELLEELTEQRKWVCGSCYQRFKTEEALQHHQYVEHGKDDAEKEETETVYKFEDRSDYEIYEEFKRVSENEDSEDLSFRYIADKSDVSHTSISNKLRKVREEYDEDAIPNLGNEKNGEGDN